MRKCQVMVCLVGENPLPVYLGVRQYLSDGGTVVLVHSAGTKTEAARLKAKLELGPVPAGVRVQLIQLADPFCPLETSRVLGRLKQPGAVLHYTGGTKVMAAFAVAQWLEGSGPTGRVTDACYLEDASTRFRWSDGVNDYLQLDPPLTTREVCDLHQARPIAATRNVPMTDADLEALFAARRAYLRDDLPWTATARERAIRRLMAASRGGQLTFRFLCGAWDHMTSTWRLNSRWLRFVEDALADPVTRQAWKAVPLPRTENEWIQWSGTDDPPIESELLVLTRMASGAWLEKWVERMLLSLGTDANRTGFVWGQVPCKPLIPDPENNLLCSYYFRVSGQVFESDLMMVLHNRLRYISITASGNAGTIKGKLFECAYRAQQIGGSLARSCVVSQADDETVCRLTGDLALGGRHMLYGSRTLDEWGQGRMPGDFWRWLTE